MDALDEARAAAETTQERAPGEQTAGQFPEKAVNEIVETARRAKQRDQEAAATEKRNAWIAAGVGVGIGSAALVAAMLYANRDKSKKKS